MRDPNPAEKRAPLPARIGLAAAMGALFFAVYGGCNTLTAWRATHGESIPTLAFAWEKSIPLIPWTAVPYWSEDLFFVLAFLACGAWPRLRTHALRVATALAGAALFFSAMPLTAEFAREEVRGPFGFLFGALHRMDKPYNLFPSLHVTLGMLMLSALLPVAKGGWKAALCAWFALIFASTLTTHQHQVADLAGGFALGLACMHAWPWPSEKREPIPDARVWAPRLAGLYLAPALLLAPGAWLLRPWGLLLLWPAWSMAAVAAGYLGLGARVYGKRNGRIGWAAGWAMAPVIAGQYLSRLWYARQSPPWNEVAPGVFIGRALNEREARMAAAQLRLSAVLDLTSEASEPAALRQLDYLNLQILDLTAPTPAQRAQGLAFVQKHTAAGGRVYIHCKAGYSRTAAMAGSWLLQSGRHANADDVVRHLRLSRPGMVIRPEAMACLR